MAELKCKDGTIIKISDETEAELRKAFGPKPDYIEGDLTINIDVDSDIFPIELSTDGGGDEVISRNVKDIEAFIVALQKAVEYCKQYNLGV